MRFRKSFFTKICVYNLPRNFSALKLSWYAVYCNGSHLILIKNVVQGQIDGGINSNFSLTQVSIVPLTFDIYVYGFDSVVVQIQINSPTGHTTAYAWAISVTGMATRHYIYI